MDGDAGVDARGAGSEVGVEHGSHGLLAPSHDHRHSVGECDDGGFLLGGFGGGFGFEAVFLMLAR